MMAAWRSSFDEFRGLPEQFTAVGADLVVVAYHEWGKPRGGSVEMEHLYGILITLRESKLARWEWFESPTDALQPRPSAVTLRSDPRGASPPRGLAWHNKRTLEIRPPWDTGANLCVGAELP